MNHNLPTFRVISFGGGFNLPLWAAGSLGIFERHGIAPSLEFTADSRQVFTGLMEFSYHVAITAFDNIVAHQEGHADPVSPESPDFFAFMGSDDGFLSLVGAPGIESVAQLAGCTISVDDPANGFSMVLLEILARHGLGHDAVRLERAGGTDRRYEALCEGHHAATMLRTPFDLLALRHGCQRLAVVRVALGPYMGIVGAARRSWAQCHHPMLAAFIRSYRDAVGWLKQPAHRMQAETLLRSHVPHMDEDQARFACDAMLHPTEGFFDDVQLDPQGMLAVTRLRARHAGRGGIETSPARHIDERYWRTAMTKDSGTRTTDTAGDRSIANDS
jgi:ABC-type nitrate/sulfonate/bicarbonate transport system substrate-binding protein